ncbi:glycosyltransferase family 1 protein [Marivivens sp. JLT3646]|uniref:glycosyltransferase family 4 protein n=1 Tax=Marivivens sp. JLT3646 TaxID=1920883 RepID=UPI000800456E|nr:glycosyltransferase family 1 protein [Marivivens sp. JLT3646]APO88546.1 hypothetical protein BSK21_15485 [Marivivens sp. JLT3646]OBR39262.1 hypothetical protein A9199_12390 [Donghicola sp. JL3646]
MKILIDMQGAQSESSRRGIGRYVVNLIDHMLSTDNKHEYILVFNGQYQESAKKLKERYKIFAAKIKCRTWFPTGVTHLNDDENKLNYQLAQDTYLAFISSLQPDVVLITTFFEGFSNNCVTAIGDFPTAIISYDFIPYLQKEHYIGSNTKLLDFYNDKLDDLQKASALLTISQSSTEEVREILKGYEGHLENIGCGYDQTTFNSNLNIETKNSIINKFKIEREFIFYCGGADVRKNLNSIIISYSKMETKLRQKYSLVFSGDIPPFEQEMLLKTASDCGLTNEDFRFLGHVNDIELAALYSSCAIHILASTHEGFGLPTLEAMACGAVCICSNLSSLPEVIGLKEATFNPYSTNDISATLQFALTDSKWRTKFASHAKKMIELFNWDQVSLKTLDALEKIGSVSNYDRSAFSLDDLIDAFEQKLNNAIVSEQMLIELAKNTADNFPQKYDRKKIYIDIANLEFVDAKTGIQRVVKSLATNLEQVIEPVYDIIFVTSFALERPELNKKSYFKSITFVNDITNASHDIQDREVISPQAGDIFISLNLDLEFSNETLNCLSRYQAIGVHLVGVLYDLIPIKFPEFWSEHPHFAPLFESWVRRVLDFDRVICISKTVADELDFYSDEVLGGHSSCADINYFHLGADFPNFQKSDSISDTTVPKDLLNSGYFMSVGTLEPRKNHALILDAFDALWLADTNVAYVIVGKEGWNVSELVGRIESHPELNNRLFWLKNATDDDLDLLYKSAKCVIAGSLAEGFGLPLIEAAQYGVPLIANDIPVFREVAQDFAYYFDGTPHGLAKSLLEWMSLEEKGQHPRTSDMPWLSWKQSAAQFAQLLDLKTRTS